MSRSPSAVMLTFMLLASGCFGGTDPPVPDDVEGCTDSEATNFDPNATEEDDSCEYQAPPPIFSCEDAGDDPLEDPAYFSAGESMIIDSRIDYGNQVANIGNLFKIQTFSRTSDAAFRAQFDAADVSQGIYINFREIMDFEETDTASWIVTNSTTGERYHINGPNSTPDAYLAQWWNDDFFNYRVSTIQGIEEGENLSALVDEDLDYVFLDVMNLYPTSHYVDTHGIPAHFTANASTQEEAILAWRQSVIDLACKVRAELPSEISMLVNGVGKQPGASAEGGFAADPMFDGSDLIATHLAQAGVTEVSFTFGTSQNAALLNAMIAWHQLSSANKPLSVTAKLDLYGDNGSSAAAIQEQINLIVMHSLVGEPGLSRMGFALPSVFASSTVLHFPLLAVDDLFGAPTSSSLGSDLVNNTVSTTLLERTFENGWAVLFNTDGSPVDIPQQYIDDQWQVVVTDGGPSHLDENGQPLSELAYLDAAGVQIQPFHGVILKAA